MASISLTMFSIALLIGSAMASITPATSPSAFPAAPTPSPSVSPSPLLPLAEPPVSLATPSSVVVTPSSSEQPIRSPPSPSAKSFTLPTADGFAPAPAPNDAVLNEVAVGSLVIGFLAMALSV